MSSRRFHPAIFAFASLAGAALAAEAGPDNLNLRYVNGILAVAEDKVITVDDVRREMAPFAKEIRRKPADDPGEWIERLQEDIVQNLIDRALIVKEFYKDEKRRVPASYVDNQLAETIMTQFGGDRSKYLAYLRSRGISQKDYRREIEEDMIYTYMRQQQAKTGSAISPVRIEAFYNENKERFNQEDSVHLHLIQLARSTEDTDDTLREKADRILAELAADADFDGLARQYSQDSGKGKGGDWGWQRRSDLRKEFSDFIFPLNKGEHSQVLVAPEGAFLFFVEDRKSAGILPIEDVRPEIEKALGQQSSRHATVRWLEKLHRNAYVKYFED